MSYEEEDTCMSYEEACNPLLDCKRDLVNFAAKPIGHQKHEP